jgi:Co/Zn/Cd efflux system component
VPVQKTYRLIIVALFGSIMAVTRLFVPSPIDKILIAVDAILLALSALFVKDIGATYVGAAGGTLTGLLRPSLIPFSIIYSILYGVLVDVFMKVFKVKASSQGVNRNKIMYAMACSTLIIGFISYYATTLFPQIIVASPMMDMMVAFFGPITGAVAGYAAAYLWNKYLRSIPM